MKVHILHDIDEGSAEIWLDPDDAIHAGLCLGSGATFAEAKAVAVEGLQDALKFLAAIGADVQFELVPR